MPFGFSRKRMSQFLAIVMIILASLGVLQSTLPERDPFKASAIVDPPFPSLTYGIQAFVWWDQGDAGKYLDLVRLMSFSHVKQTFPWRDLEPLPGTWDWEQADRIVGEASRRNLRVIARLGKVPAWASSLGSERVSAESAHDAPPAVLADWSNYCFSLSQRFRGKIAAYQIWNEPNLSREWGNNPPDPAGYVELLAACSQAIRRADPDAILISAGLSPTGTNGVTATPDDVFLDHMYRNDFQQFVDVVGVHAPGYAAPEIGPDNEEAKQRWFTFRRVEDLRKIMLRYNDEERQMAIMEFGYTTDTRNPVYAWFGVTEAQQADYLFRAYEYAIANWRPWIGLMTLIYLPDPTWQHEHEEFWWSIIEPDTGEPRMAYIKLANMRKVCNEHIIPARPADSPVAKGLRPAPICP